MLFRSPKAFNRILKTWGEAAKYGAQHPGTGKNQLMEMGIGLGRAIGMIGALPQDRSIIEQAEPLFREGIADQYGENPDYSKTWALSTIDAALGLAALGRAAVVVSNLGRGYGLRQAWRGSFYPETVGRTRIVTAPKTGQQFEFLYGR